MDSVQDLTIERLERASTQDLRIHLIEIGIKVDNCLAYESFAPVHDKMNARGATAKYLELKTACRRILEERGPDAKV